MFSLRSHHKRQKIRWGGHTAEDSPSLGPRFPSCEIRSQDSWSAWNRELLGGFYSNNFWDAKSEADMELDNSVISRPDRSIDTESLPRSTLFFRIDLWFTYYLHLFASFSGFVLTVFLHAAIAHRRSRYRNCLNEDGPKARPSQVRLRGAVVLFFSAGKNETFQKTVGLEMVGGNPEFCPE